MPSSPTFAGDFEVHTTVDLRLPVNRFVADCESLGLKPLVIELPIGAAPVQPMTSAYYPSTTLPIVLVESREMAADFRRLGHPPIRLKIEAAPGNDDIPDTDVAAARMPSEYYFEHHLKVVVRDDRQLWALREAAMVCDSHVSKNSLRRSSPDKELRFITMRTYAVGRHTAESRADMLEQAVRATDAEVLKRICEYCVYDDNLSLDDGWAA